MASQDRMPEYSKPATVAGLEDCRLAGYDARAFRVELLRDGMECWDPPRLNINLAFSWRPPQRKVLLIVGGIFPIDHLSLSYPVPSGSFLSERRQLGWALVRNGSKVLIHHLNLQIRLTA
jgi:hypothetical protein